VRSGAIQEADTVCGICAQRRSYRYAGSVLSDVDHGLDELCPWCIADGTAARRWQARYGELDPDQDGGAPPDVADRVFSRTPGYVSWNDDHWPGHHADVCVFLGPVRTEAERRRLTVAQGIAVTAAVRALAAAQDLPADGTLDPADGPEAYLFGCRHCDAVLAYAEMHWVAGPFVAPPYPHR
jgi:uncharacterized protein CbrC (UPF0167 family)